MNNSTIPAPFKSKLAYDTFLRKYSHKGCETWEALCSTLVNTVCSKYMSKEDLNSLLKYMQEMKFIPGGRYLYYAGRDNPYYNNCYLLKAEEDTKEDWARLSWKTESCLMTGGGIGIDYSVYRPKGDLIKTSGGYSTGPVAKMKMINEIGRYVMQGGSRRSAIYASLNWQHKDAKEFLYCKNWNDQKVIGTQYTVGDLKEKDFNYKADLDMTNISINYDDAWLDSMNKHPGKYPGDVFIENVNQAISTGEPGFSFNFGKHSNETLRNACCEVTSADDSDVCNLGSVNLSRIQTLEEFKDVVRVATKFLLCGTLEAKLPYEEVYKTREKNRRLGLGLMGVHQWLLVRKQRYEVTPELHDWLKVYRNESDKVSAEFADELKISRPIANRAIAPTGTISMISDSTGGIEPIYAVAYKRRYLVGDKWKAQYHIDHLAKHMIDNEGIEPNDIETSNDLAEDYERRIKFQADIQDYVDMAISSTINLPRVPSGGHSVDYVLKFAEVLARYAPRLRGFTCYPDGARGGQPLTAIKYETYLAKSDKEEFDDEGEFNDACDIRGGGFCGS